jgi:hypothetical protein
MSARYGLAAFACQHGGFAAFQHAPPFGLRFQHVSKGLRMPKC